LKLNVDSSGSICGATIKTYLLEKTRLVSVNSQNERNFHVFYELLSDNAYQSKLLFGNRKKKKKCQNKQTTKTMK